MDPKLAQAAYSGDVNFLRESLSVCQKFHNNNYNCCFSTQHRPKNPKKEEAGNIFHLSGRNNRVEFFQEAIRILPDPIVDSLLTQREPNSGWNPLHVAAKVGHVGIVKLILGFYGLSESDQAQVFESKPWLAPDWRERTPFHVGLYHGRDECTMEMMRFLSFDDVQVVCNLVDKDGNSLLFLAVRKGCNRVALHILMYAPYYSLSAKNGSTPLHFVMNSSEEVLRQLLERHPEYVKAINYTVLRKWTESGKLWPLEYLLDIAIAITPESKRHLVDLIYQTNNHGNNLFHVAAKGRKFKAARILANVYREEKRANESTPKRGSFKEAKHDHDHDHNVPWLIPNKKGETPLGLAMTDYKRAYDEYNDHLTQEIIGMNLVIKGKHELLFLAIEKGLYQAAEGILDIQHKYGWSLYSPQGWEIWDAALKFSEQAAIWVAHGLLSLTANRDEFITHTLYSVSKNDKTKFVKWMLKNTSALRLAPLAWIEACHKGHFSTIMAFINNCEYFTELCFEKEDTPLHHIRFKVYEQYEDIMKNPIMSRLKNFQDFEGQTPLHKAVKNRDLLLTKLLLSMDDVFRSIKDKSHKTAMDLLVEACDESWEWDEMCKHIGIIPGVKMTYFQDKTNMLEVRNTLSVVAVLLATITFTAGFTLPGGVKSDTTGKATLGNKAAFLIFLIADALAMCCSMLVLVCLIWSMVCDYYKSLLLVNRSVPVLMLALYSTLVAFMSGVYVVIPHKSLWVAIVILVMCFTFIILSKRSVMDKLINKPYPARKYKDKFQMMEQGETSTSQEGSCSWICGKACTYLGGSNSQQQKSE